MTARGAPQPRAVHPGNGAVAAVSSQEHCAGRLITVRNRPCPGLLP